MALMLKDFVIGLTKDRDTKQNRELLRFDEIEIPAGRYAVSGKTGSGKSCFLSKIRGIRCNGIYAHGTITIQHKESSSPDVFEVTQKDYNAPFSSMIEILTGKTEKELEGDDEIRAKAKELLLTFKIDDKGENGIAGRLDEKKNWDTLSGGESKRVALIAAILQKPSVVIFDESFVGMDKATLKVVQDVIRKELADSVILITDHECVANNMNDFYPYNLHLENNKLVLRDFDPALIPVEDEPAKGQKNQTVEAIQETVKPEQGIL